MPPMQGIAWIYYCLHHKSFVVTSSHVVVATHCHYLELTSIIVCHLCNKESNVIVITQQSKESIVAKHIISP
jgi:hypothetical protein